MKPARSKGRILLVLSLIWLAGSAFGETRQNSPSLKELLDQAGRRVELFREQYPAVTCIEGLTQLRFSKGKDIVDRQEAKFDYLILMSLQDNTLHVEESRFSQKSPEKKVGTPLLVTSGFSTLILVFHPLYQDSFEFTQMPEEIIGGKRVIPIQFEHIPGTRSITALRRDARDIPLELKGTAWLATDTWAITKIAAQLAVPVTDLGLQALNAEVEYSPVRFASAEGVHWLPSMASIEVATIRQHWRNVHRFTDYRRFSVASESKVRK